MAMLGPRSFPVPVATLLVLYSAGHACAQIRFRAVDTGYRGLSQIPTFVTQPPGESCCLYVTEQSGQIRVIRDGVMLSTPFLDLTSVVFANQLESGLLGLTFHPQFAQNGDRKSVV